MWYMSVIHLYVHISIICVIPVLYHCFRIYWRKKAVPVQNLISRLCTTLSEWGSPRTHALYSDAGLMQ